MDGAWLGVLGFANDEMGWNSKCLVCLVLPSASLFYNLSEKTLKGVAWAQRYGFTNGSGRA